MTWAQRQRGASYDLCVFLEKLPVSQCHPTGSVDPNYVVIKLPHLNNDADFIHFGSVIFGLVLNSLCKYCGEKQEMRLVPQLFRKVLAAKVETQNHHLMSIRHFCHKLQKCDAVRQSVLQRHVILLLQ
ncbi:hypothetical protein RRG08_013728 [Elysia crispata]|uniref:Uncharacterized protein n=1 Tax=Elysia crispata TaxID=231223 RepID=A0AAE0ZQI5_9GAST|nr:hypothetical protein RRG08_013728 [Elysia crispata]